MSQRRTKIIATVGPAQDPPGALERLLDSGVDLLRVNLSHAAPRAQAERVRRARAHRPDIAVLADLAGPKLRLGDFAEDVKVAEGETLVLGAGGVPGGRSVALRPRPRRRPGVHRRRDDRSRSPPRSAATALVCRVRVGGTVRSRKGINLPLDTSSLPALTEKDRQDLADIDVLAPDFIALSYVRHERDIADARALTDLPVVAKIEKQQALERLDAIVHAADAIMVARGDLGVEIPIERVPATQKRIIRAANRAGRPVITATQMLMSMVSNPLPTRAEVTDVANAVLDGTDAVMLSEETAVGHDPPGAVNMMIRLLVETEPLLAAARGAHARRGVERAGARRRGAGRRPGRRRHRGADPHGRKRAAAGRLPPAPPDPRLQPRPRDDAPVAPDVGRARHRSQRRGGRRPPGARRWRRRAATWAPARARWCSTSRRRSASPRW